MISYQPSTPITKIMKKIAFLILSLFFAGSLGAQTKVFKEVGEEISTQIKTITQDNALVGYLAFTRLEKADADSFNYRITIMDENLNDIGTLNFREKNLELQGVSFEEDVLCLGYISSPMAGVLTGKEARKAYKNRGNSQVLVQFINLSGKILQTYNTKVELTSMPLYTRGSFTTHEVTYLKHGMQVKNIAKTGFCVFYGDETRKDILVFDTKGHMIRDRRITADATNYYLLASSPNIYLLTKTNGFAPEGGYTVYTYSTVDSTAEYKYDLKDKQGDWLKVLSFDNDPVTGKAFLAGCIINPDRTKDYITARDYSRNPYLGVFALNLGNTNKDAQVNYSYWYNEKIPEISGDGLFKDKSFYVKYATAFKDYSGNTVFAGTALIEKRLLGAAKYKLADGVFILQDVKGKLKLDNTVTCDETSYFGPAGPIIEMDKKSFYRVVNSETKTNYAIIDDEKNFYIYNVNGQKLMRTIQHKDGNVKTEVYPAKEGHIMVAEFNRKGKYTRFSIEGLQ
jgi:hypothetical protein